MYVELAFRLQATRSIPVDHGYALYAAIAHLIPEVHQENGVAIHPIRGRQVGERRLELMPWSSLILRAPSDQLRGALKLAGKPLRLVDSTVRVGTPEIRALNPSSTARSRIVVIKVAHTDASQLTDESFAIAARRQLGDLGIDAGAKLTAGKRRTLRLKHRVIVGYETLVEGLSPTESLILQERGLGGKRHMGCGVFVGVDDTTK